MMTLEPIVLGNKTSLPTIHVISDSVGVTAQAVARAAASQFGVKDPYVEVLSQVDSYKDIERFLKDHAAYHLNDLGDDTLLVFYTLVDEHIREEFERYLACHPNIVAVDILTSAVSAIGQVSGRVPASEPGMLHETDEDYFKRIAAIEFTIAHDDGRNPQDLPLADMVLIGVSRTSKTPLSIYLGQQGYRVANVPLDLRSDPPKELAEVEPTRLFGLMTTPELLIHIRKQRLGSAASVASSYADPEQVYQDLDKSRALMRKLGCIVIHTENRAVEETAQEIMRYHELAHPRPIESSG